MTQVLDTSHKSLQIACDILSQGGLVAFPTETVYGIGADGLNPDAVAKIFIAKGRPQDNPLILHVAHIDDFSTYAHDIPSYVFRLAHAFCPGPLTFVLYKKPNIPDIVTAGLQTVCLRIPQHQIALDLIESIGRPLAAPSANLSGRPSPTEAQHVLEDLDGRIDAVIDGGITKIGIESTVIDCTGEIPVILREGAVTREMIAQVLDTVVDHHIGHTKKSPGTRYRHYAPTFPIEIVRKEKRNTILHNIEGSPDEVFLFWDPEYPLQHQQNIYHFSRQEDLSQALFSLFRKLEKMNIKQLFIEEITEGPLAHALMNRIEKAAGGGISVNADSSV